MAPRPAESARTTITITNPRRSAFIVTVPHGLTGGSAGDSNANLSKPPAKLQYNMRIANCRLTVVFVVVLVIFGPQKLPELARSFGKLMAEFRKASGDFKSAFEEEMRDLERQARVAELKKQAAEATAAAAAALNSIGNPASPATPAATLASPAGTATET